MDEIRWVQLEVQKLEVQKVAQLGSLCGCVRFTRVSANPSLALIPTAEFRYVKREMLVRDSGDSRAMWGSYSMAL